MRKPELVEAWWDELINPITGWTDIRTTGQKRQRTKNKLVSYEDY